ncbi:uncharacterized protein LOC122282350 [Carya illinoinensis]|uniref:uncharacterized protein LOC122282350 n=1 Tax=Carya illinoinensis TaxID=32201 RepID=UPI001C71E7E7|nr:uncharacterized protein LOC122282350 [Carya illinoinensis]
MEALSRMISALVLNGRVSGYSIGPIGGGSMNISHLFFVDDSLFFCEANRNQVQVLKALLLCFEASSGLKVNLDKSKMVPVRSVQNLRQLANTLECKMASLPMTYLGLPLGAASRAASIWDIVIEKVERCLAGWKRMNLSKGERITLIKNTLSNLPTIANAKDISVEEVRVIAGGQIQWNINFSWAANDWEMDSIEALLSLLYSLQNKN